MHLATGKTPRHPQRQLNNYIVGLKHPSVIIWHSISISIFTPSLPVIDPPSHIHIYIYMTLPIHATAARYIPVLHTALHPLDAVTRISQFFSTNVTTVSQNYLEIGAQIRAVAAPISVSQARLFIAADFPWTPTCLRM